MLMAVRTQVDTKIHPAQSYIQKDTFVEVGKSDISPTFDQVLESLLANDEYLAFAPNTSDTKMMINILSYKYPLIKLATKVYKDESELDTYLKSDHYAACNEVKNCSNPKIKGAIVFHGQGPYLYDYSIRLNHTWAFSGFPDLQQVMDSFIIFYAQQKMTNEVNEENVDLSMPLSSNNQSNSLKIPWSQFLPSTTRLAPFPTREYTDDEFQSIIKDVMGFAISSGIITVCTMGTLFKYSDKSLVFMYFFVFGLSAIMLSFLISTFFTRAKSAVAVGTLAFLGAFFPYYTVNDEGVSMVLKILASLLSPTAFALGSVNFADYERAHVGLRWSNIWRASSGVCFLICLVMMVFDSLLYFAIGLYLDKVLHKENGFVYPWNFIFPKGFWMKRNTITQLASSVEGNGDTHSKEVCTSSQSSMEAISLDMKQQEMDGRCIQIRNLHKVYNSSKGKCCAVDSLRLTLYENQILALLGHNGAGKSTTISMLVGLLTPTSGDALVFGKSILTDMVKEHLEIFANIKGVNEESLENSVTEMVDEVGLADKLNTVVSALSGGMKRKLSLGIALIGDSKVSHYIEGGWIQRFKNSTYRFPNPEEALQDAIEAAGPTLGPLLLSMSEYLMSSFNESYESRYGAIVMDAQNDDGSIGYTVLHNSTCQHAAPTFINLMNSAILRLATLNGNMTIQTRNHPLPMTESQRLQRQDLDAFSAAIVVSIAFSFIPASFAVAIVKEREVKAKHQQLISGVSILSYWISTYIWDFISYLVPASFAMLLFYIFGLEQFIGSGSLLPTVLILLEYGFAIASSTYCLTFFFSEHSMAQNVVLLVHFFTGIVLMVISFIMGFIPATQDMNSVLKNFFRLSPGFCFADGLASLALLRQGMKVGSSQGYFGWNVSGGSICYLAAEGIIYFLLTLGLEVFPPHKFSSFGITEFLRSLRRSSRPVSDAYAEPLLSSSTKSAAIDLDEDIDVQTERNRVLSGSIDKAIIYLRNLRKVFPGGRNYSKKVAVHSLTFSVQEGECFGFLGTNGAGKTTTLSMLSGEVYPSDGTAFIFGQDMRLNPKAARQLIGYCPQFDALLEFLTVQEHLELYARIKGVPDYMLDNVVMDKLLEFDLLRHASKQSFTLSGGNKRKLSVAIAMIGDPPIVFLDEPSTGMDPIAKRFMWEVISRLSTRSGKTAVILTTHSMNEAQALCTRIGIMVGGKLRCIGSPQHLKTRFGNHLELEVKPTEVSSVDLENLCQMIQERLFDIPSHPRGIFGDLEVCIRGPDSITSEDASATEISLSREMIILIGRWLGNEERIRTLTDNVGSSGASNEQLPEQLARDEWWVSKREFSVIDSFVLSSFPGATSQGSNGLSVKYQLPRGEDFSLADVFGLVERNRNQLGIAEYSIGQSTLETIFSHFAANA
ncbi:ATP-binding cassette A1 [Artemisia annua]|uniref:ATP-binding cassette A1 n=1 Tax=Artemisia annua TaxID=35608 RepID=A0A2U1PBH9_ARTAN|nr:ATP-binding cassette A1 [Artemisia annua]